MRDRYVFPAYLCYEGDDFSKIGVVFPDLPGCTSQGEGEEEAMAMAKEAMTLHLWGMEEDGEEIPKPTPARDLTPETDQTIVLVDAFLPPFRERMNNKAVTKSVTVPRWLDLEAKAANLNYSQVLQDGIIELLGLQKKTAKQRRTQRKTA